MSIKKDIKEIASTVVDIAKELAKTGKLLSTNPNERMNVCRACPCFHEGRCSRDKCPGVGCNCWMQTKTQFAGSKCPAGKW